MGHVKMNSEMLLNSFLRFEDEYGMFQCRVGKVKIWHYVRMHVFLSLVDIFGLGELMLDSKVNPNIRMDPWNDFFRAKIEGNQFLAHRRDVLIIPHERKYKEQDGYYRCIYTDLLDQAMTRSHYILDSKSVEGIYARQRSKNVIYADLEAFNKIYKIPKDILLMDKGMLAKSIIEPLEHYYHVTIPAKHRQKWMSIINGVLKGRPLLWNYYVYMLHRIRPKIIIMTVAYASNRMILCEVAKKMNIPTVELQHGTINRTQVQYNFSKKMSLRSFPDYVFTFGQLEKKTVRFPIDSARIIPVGFPELENSYTYYRKNRQKRMGDKKRILFISQGLIEIAEYAAAVADALDNEEYSIIFKLHPKEYGNWKSKYKECFNKPNIHVVGDFNTTIHSYLAEADWVVGSYSTVLYEATMFQTKIAVIKTALYNGMSDLYDNGYAVLVDSPAKLVEVIHKDFDGTLSKEGVFERDSVRNMLERIEQIISGTASEA